MQQSAPAGQAVVLSNSFATERERPGATQVWAGRAPRRSAPTGPRRRRRVDRAAGRAAWRAFRGVARGAPRCKASGRREVARVIASACRDPPAWLGQLRQKPLRRGAHAASEQKNPLRGPFDADHEGTRRVMGRRGPRLRPISKDEGRRRHFRRAVCGAARRGIGELFEDRLHARSRRGLLTRARGLRCSPPTRSPVAQSGSAAAGATTDLFFFWVFVQLCGQPTPAWAGPGRWSEAGLMLAGRTGQADRRATGRPVRSRSNGPPAAGGDRLRVCLEALARPAERPDGGSRPSLKKVSSGGRCPSAAR